MSPDLNRCTEPAIYASQTAGSFEEGRAFLLGRYVEKELDAQLEAIIREHLKRCVCCSNFLKKLDHDQEFQIAETTIIYTSCPSSKNLDKYVFAPAGLSAPEHLKIEQHLRDCSFCKEETEWLKSCETPKTTTTPASRRNWIQYASIAAALIFMVLSVFLFSQRFSVKNTEDRLRAAAVIKTPDQIDYASLLNTSVSLPARMADVYQEGVESLKNRRFQEAIRHLEIVATAHPEHSGAVFLLGYSYYQMNEPEKAFELCDRAEKIVPHSVERCLSLVNIALKTGHFGRAIREISGLHHVAPNHPEVKKTYETITAITGGHVLKL